MVACLVPLSAGGAGMILGTSMLSHDADPSLDSHFRYLSGLLFAIGLGFLSTVPNIERKQERFRVLTCLVVVGGLARLAGALAVKAPPGPMLLAIGMELVVTPALCLWQSRVSRRATNPPVN